MLPAKIYSFAVPASGTYELPVVGNFFKLLSSTGTLQVAGDSFGTLGLVLPGQGLRETDFQKLQFTDTTGAINNVRVLVAGEEFIDDRITGEVSVIDGGKSRTYAESAFMAVLTMSAPGVGFYAHVGLRNTNSAASGVQLVLKSYRLCADSSIYVAAAGTATALTTVPGTVLSNKKVGGAAASTVNINARTQSNAASLIVNRQDQIVAGPANNAVIVLQEPIVVPPQYNFNWGALVDNVGIAVTVEFTVETVL